MHSIQGRYNNAFKGRRAKRARLNAGVMRASFVGAALASLAFLGCAAPPKPFDPAVDALEACLLGESQAGWMYLPVAPSNAVEMRDAISMSKAGPKPIPNEAEYWFQHTDGRIMRCTFSGLGFYPEGTPPMCGVSTHTLRYLQGTWSAEPGALVLCTHR